MAAARSFDEKRARIRALTSAPVHEARADLKKYLADKNGYLVGEAAEAAKKLELVELVPDLAAGFMTLLVDGPKRDTGCLGKFRIVEALLSFDAHEPDVYLSGLRHRQIEGSYPEPIDTAAGLRGLCAHALLRIHHRTALLDVTPLLFDDYDVTRAEAAALALGESRAQGAFEALRRGWEKHRSGRAAEGVLLGIALLRSDKANDYLVSLVEGAPEGEAALALSALALHRHDKAIVLRLGPVVRGRKSRRLAEVFAAKIEG
jgi:hypothetical protein